MVKTLNQRLKSIRNHEVESNYTFSIFENWLTEEQCVVEILSAYDVNSFEDYSRIKDVELLYLKLVSELNKLYSVRFITNKFSIASLNKKPTFNELYREVSSHVNHCKEKFFYICEIETIVLLSHDFNIYLYAENNVVIDKLIEVIKSSQFYQLH